MPISWGARLVSGRSKDSYVGVRFRLAIRFLNKSETMLGPWRCRPAIRTYGHLWWAPLEVWPRDPDNRFQGGQIDCMATSRWKSPQGRARHWPMTQHPSISFP